MAIKKAQGRIISLLMMMIVIFIVLSSISIQQLRKSDEARITDELIERIHSSSLNLFLADVGFFGYELNNDKFFQSWKSIYISDHDSIMQTINEITKSATEIENMEIDSDLLEIGKMTTAYDSTFQKILAKIKTRGYNNHGLNAELKRCSKELSSNISTNESLQLKLFEGNYQLSGKQQYADHFDSLVNVLKIRYQSNQRTESMLSTYVSQFNNFVILSNSIGLESHTGLKEELDNRTKSLIASLNLLEHKADANITATYQTGMTFMFIGVIGGCILCISIIIVIARNVANLSA